jgi:NADH-quinone oxidoreductase subunit N
MTLAQVVEFQAPEIDWWALAPQLILVGVALVLLLGRALWPRPLPEWVGTWVSVAAGVATFAVAYGLWLDVRDNGARSVVADALGIDGFSLFFTMLVAVTVVLTALLADGYLGRNRMMAQEFHVLLLTSATGAVVMASANDLIVLFLGLETLSIGLYVMAAMQLLRLRSQEAAIKYFVLGAFSSAFLLYGIALVYGATGSTNLVAVRTFLVRSPLFDTKILLAGFALLLAGLAFKVAAVPFHMWAPDVYQGSPSPVSGYMASAAKAAGFAAMLRVFFVAFGSYSVEWQPLVAVLAAVTLLGGAIMAIVQTDVKRMLAYSSISHAGFVLVAVAAASDQGTAAALFYLFTYTLMIIGSFGVVALVGTDVEGTHPLTLYRGLARTRPLLAFAFTFFLLGQAGVPFTSGFVAKFLVIGSAVDVQDYVLAALAMLSAVIAAYMYLRIVLGVYRAPEALEVWAGDVGAGDVGADDEVGADQVGPARPVAVPWPSGLALAGAFAFTLVVGFLPQFFIEFSRDAVPVLLAGS